MVICLAFVSSVLVALGVYFLFVEIWRQSQPDPPSKVSTQFRSRPAVLVQAATLPVPNDLPRLSIEVAKPDIQRLRDYSPSLNREGASAVRPFVILTVRDRGAVYTNVALHLKGAMGSFRPIDSKPAITLNFSKYASGQKFHGYTKLSLNNSVQDASFLCEVISREMFQAAGVPASQASHATVVLNGRDLGFYVLVEGYGKTFLQRHFSNPHGNLYYCGAGRDVNRKLEVNSGDHPEDRSDINWLVEAARERTSPIAGINSTPCWTWIDSLAFSQWKS